MNQPTPQQTVARMHRDLRHYVAAQKPSDPIRQLSDRHVREMAAVAFQAIPAPRDVDVVSRRGRKPEADGMPLDGVLQLLTTELDATGIGEALGLTLGQVQRRMKALYAQLGVTSRHGAVLAAIRDGLLRLEDGAWRASEGAEIASGAGVSPD